MINVIDDRMGSSKTSAMIEYMNNNKENKKFIFVTPFLEEVKRVKDACGFQEPERVEYESKIEAFKKMILSDANIVTTHALFKIIDLETIEILKQKEYTLVLDEVLDVVAETSLTRTDIDALINLEILEKKENGEIVGGKDDVLRKYIGEWKYEEIVNNLLRHTLEFYREYSAKHNTEKIALMWLFPVDLLRCFEDIYILTYCFDGYPLKYYLDLHNLKQRKLSVEILNTDAEYKDRRYRFVPYKLRSNADIKSKIKILEGNVINNIGENENAFSVTWYSRVFTKSETNTQLKKNLLNVINNRFTHSKIDDIMWTTFLNNQESLHNERLKERNLLAHNIRATNKYRNKLSLIYLVNRRYNPIIYQWFKDKGILVNEDEYALGELIQWVFRSAIRDGGNIEIYIPSSRMRNMLIKWLDN